VAEVFCNRCGHRNPAGSRFCSSCGTPLEGVREDRTAAFTLPDAETTEEEAGVEAGDLPEGMGMLVITRGAGAGSRFVLDQPVVSAGRHPDSDIFLDDITVSRRHAEIVRADGGYVVRDVGSLNGTYLNRQRIEDAAIAHGDELQIGKYRLVFFSGGVPAAGQG
jgi:pSer/pThr/pTyr-binding forkhead associated (FHA) protein